MKLKLFSFLKRTIILISICIILGLGAIFFAVWNVSNYKQQRIEKTQEALSIHVEVISNGLQELFTNHVNHLKFLANDPSIKEAFLLEKSHDFLKDFCLLKNLITHHLLEMSSITMITTQGKMFHRHPFLSDSILDYSDQDDVAYVLHQRKSYVSNVFINAEGKTSISISHPVYDKDNFIGIVRITVYIETIINLFIEPIIERNREVIIFNNYGNLLHHENENPINHSFKEVITKYKTAFPKHNWKSFEKVMNKISGKENGVSVFDDIDEKTNKIQKNIAAFGSVQVFNKVFSIVVSKDYDLVMLPAKQYVYKFWVFILIILILFVVITITLFNNRKKRIILLKENEFLKEIGEKTIKIKEQRDNYHLLANQYFSQNEKLIKSNKKVEKSEKKYKSLFENMSEAFALCKIVQDEQNKVIDYVFIEVNNAFELQAGLKRDKLINKKVSGVMPGIKSDSANWIETYGKVAMSGEPLRFEQFSEPLQKWFSVIVFSPEHRYFATLFSDITERNKARQEILNATILAEEQERNRVAKELHDGVSPLLSTINLFVQTLKKPKEPNIQNDLYIRIENVLQETIDSITEISNNLSPHILFNFGLNTAIERFIENLSKISDINIIFKSNLNDVISTEYKMSLYRVTTELLNNTYKHANATEIIISITINNKLELMYKDNGIGFDIKKAVSGKNGMGLFNIINRIESLNGKVIMESEKGKGVNVQVTLSLV